LNQLKLQKFNFCPYSVVSNVNLRSSLLVCQS